MVDSFPHDRRVTDKMHSSPKVLCENSPSEIDSPANLGGDSEAFQSTSTQATSFPKTTVIPESLVPETVSVIPETAGMTSSESSGQEQFTQPHRKPEPSSVASASSDRSHTETKAVSTSSKKRPKFRSSVLDEFI